MNKIRPIALALVLCTSLYSTEAPVAKTTSYLPLTNEVKIQPITKAIVNSTTATIIPNHVSPSESAKIKVFEILVGAVVTITVSTFTNLPSLMNFYDKYLGRTSITKEASGQSTQAENIITPHLKVQATYFDVTDPENWVGYGCANNYARVLEVQKFLNRRMNAGLICDGKFGSETYKAIVKFQENINGLSEDGVVGPNTWHWLLKDNGNI